jgi:hypothetical protein
MVFEQVGPFLGHATSQVSVVPLNSVERNEIMQLAERMKEILDTAVERQQLQAR